MEDNWGQVKTTQNGENKDVEPEENGSKGESRWEQSGMSEGASDSHGIGAISQVKHKAANVQPQTESGTA